MKVVAFNGSPHMEGNTAILVNTDLVIQLGKKTVTL